MEYIRFGELYDIPSSNGLSRPSAVRGEGYKMVNMGELFANNIINDMPMERVKMSERELKKSLLNEGDLLFARQSLVAAGAGKCSIVNKLKEETTFESHLIRVRLNKKVADSWYYYYLFQLPYNPIKTIVNQCAQAGIRGSELVRIKVPVPSLEIQQKIASILFSYDELIENNNKRIKLLEQMAENLYKEWFVRFRFPNHGNYSMKDSVLGEIPDNFDVVKINTLISYYIGGGWGEDEPDNQYCKESYVVRGTDFPHFKVGRLGTCPLRYHKQSNYNARELRANDIVLEVSGGTQEQPVGRSILITKKQLNRLDNRLICASFCKQMRCDAEKIVPRYLYHWLQYMYETRMIEKFQLQSTGIINFKFEYFLKKCDVLLPPYELMQQFKDIVEIYYAEIDTIAEQNQNLIKQRDLLLPRLMSGKLEV